MINKVKEKIQLQGFSALQNNNFNGAIIMPTGVGKSWILIQSLLALPKAKSILYCCDNRKLRDEDFPNELTKWGADSYLDIMDRLCYQSAYKLKKQSYDILLLDEGDYMLTPKYLNLLKYNKFKHIIFVSATLDESKRKLIEQFVPIVFDIKMNEIEGTGVVNEAKGFLVNYMLTPEENRKYLSYNEAFKKSLNVPNVNKKQIEAIQRNRKMFLGTLDSSLKQARSLAKHLYDKHPDNKILIFCNFSEQADRVCKFSFHSKNEKNNTYLSDFDEGKIRVLSVVGKIDRGINLKNVGFGIFESAGESKTKMTQKSGRLRRLGVDEHCELYFLIPFFRDRRGEIKPTIVQKWVVESTADLGIKFKTINMMK